MRLVYLNGANSGTSKELVPPGLCIGRETDNDIQLLIAGVSRYHAKITFDGVHWILFDLDSTNGTRVNGERITAERILNPGDKITIGDQLMEFADSPEASAGSTVPSFVFEPPSPENISVRAPDATVRNLPPPPVPAPASVPASAAAPAAAPASDSSGSILEKLKAASGSGSIFGSNTPGTKSSSGTEKNGKKNTLFSGRMGNLIFALFVIMLALIGVWAFMAVKRVDREAEQSQAGAEIQDRKLPFTLFYERLQFSQDNVFRFSLKVEERTALFVLDDLKYHRRFEKKVVNADANHLELLKRCLRENDFASLRIQGSRENEMTDTRTLVVVLDRKMVRVTAPGNALSRSFERIEEGISNFADWNGIRIVVNVEETRQSAANALKVAEQLFDNYRARPENLRKAITQYKLVIRYLGDMDPKPQEWKIANRRLEAAAEIMKKQRKTYHDAIVQYNELKQYREAAELCQKMMDLIGESSKSYITYKEYKLVFEAEHEKIRKGRK